MISIDVEAQPARASANHIDTLIYGRLGQDEEYGIGRMFDIAEKNNVRLTCFLDYAEQHIYGEKLLDVGRYIVSRGQDLQVHLHPEFLSASLFEKQTSRRENDLFAVSREQAELLLDYAVQTHSQISTKQPVAFRGGGYRYSGPVLSILAKHGFRFNSCYNPARINQPFNIGPLRQFQWTENIIELPISCIANFKRTKRLYEYNFNGDLLLRGTIDDCLQSHNLFLQTFFKTYGDDAVAVLVMHSWSLLKFNKESGHYDDVRQDAAEKFAALLGMLTKNYTIVSADELASANNIQIDRIEEWKRNTFTVSNDAPASCAICGESTKNFKENNGIRRVCSVCGSLERQRTFARLLQSDIFPHDLSGKRILLISPSLSERRIFEKIKNAQITTLALRKEEKVDIVADICFMPQVAGKSFDVIFASHVLVHVHDLQAALGELSRILTAKGIFISYEPFTPGCVTEQITDPEKITDHYGKEAYEKYRLGRFRNFGDLDVDSVFARYFERSKYQIEDGATSVPIFWNVWKKIDLSRQTEALHARAEISQPAEDKTNTFRRSLRKDEWLFFKRHVVSQGEQAELYGHLTSLENRTVFITDIQNTIRAVLKITGKTAKFVMQRLEANSNMECGAPAPLTTVQIPEDLCPGIYFIDGEWLFIVRGNPAQSDVAVVLPVSTLHFFNNFFGGSVYDARYSGLQYLRCSMMRPVSRSYLFVRAQVSKEFLQYILHTLSTRTIAWIPEYELPTLPESSLPALMIICGRSEYWSKEARNALQRIVDAGTNILCTSAETMYREISIDFGTNILERNRHYSFVKNDNNILRNIVGCNPYDGGFLQNMTGDDDPGYGNYTILDAAAPFFDDTGLTNEDTIPLPSMAYDGIPVRSYDAKGYPIPDLTGFDRWQDIRLFAFCCGKDSPQQHIGAFARFDAGPGKGYVVHMGSMGWSSHFAFAPGNPAPRIMTNSIHELLQDKNSSQKQDVTEELPIMFPYESLQKVAVTPEIIRRCERILAKGWDRDGCFTSLHDIPWRLQSGDSRSFNFRIHCLDMCEQLLLAFSSGGSQKFFDAAARTALEWCERYCGGRNSEDSPYIWYDMSVGMRAFRLAYIYDVLRRNNTGGREDRELIWKSLLEHRRYLEDDANIAFHSNHGYYQMVGQMAMGRRLASYQPDMQDFYTQGQERFARMLHTQFTKEGIQRENSPDYQRMLLLTLRACVESGLIQAPDILAFTDSIEHTLSSFVCPDQTILQFGDSDAREIKVSTTGTALTKWSEAAMQYMASGGQVGKAPEEGLQAYPQSGYAVVRTYGKAFPATFQDQSYLAFNAAFHSRTHRHADDLTLTWYDRGQHILVDSGRYGYVGKTEKGSPLWQDGFWYSDPFRVYCESTRAHNTLEFDGRNNPRRGAPMYGSALQRWKEQDGIFAVEAELRLFKTIRRARTLLFRPGAWLLIADWFHDNAGEPHTVRQWFHTAPHLTMQPEADGWRCDLDGGTSLQVTSLLAEMRPMPVIRGQESPEHQGWCSRQPLEKTPNDAFGYEMRERPSGNFATLFTFSAAQADRQWSQVNSSGRRGRFRWKDADGVHSIMLERPAEGELTFSHTIAK